MLASEEKRAPGAGACGGVAATCVEDPGTSCKDGLAGALRFERGGIPESQCISAGDPAGLYFSAEDCVIALDGAGDRE